ncbi:MAG: (4Fe-4S)-binding protein [Bacteroidota bacterium]|nr:(4Fe-4S)-binding protein [Bacteroidota bacterium]
MSNPDDRDYTNGEITVFWKPDECIHATTCFMRLRKVFDPAKRPWVNMDGAPTDDIIRIVDECPTDALTWKFNNELSEEEVEKSLAKPKGEEKVPTPPAAEVTIIENGPAIIKGNFKVADGMGNKIETANQIALCRCGGSRNLPFCDGSHLVNGFKG